MAHVFYFLIVKVVFQWTDQKVIIKVIIFKENFQSVLRTLESLFACFCFVSCKTSQNVNIL